MSKSNRSSFGLESIDGEDYSEAPKDVVLRDWVEDPIKCGFLKCFADLEFSGENINYLIAVDEFVDKILM